jgi:hypothetical protein
MAGTEATAAQQVSKVGTICPSSSVSRSAQGIPVEQPLEDFLPLHLRKEWPTGRGMFYLLHMVLFRNLKPHFKIRRIHIKIMISEFSWQQENQLSQIHNSIQSRSREPRKGYPFLDLPVPIVRSGPGAMHGHIHAVVFILAEMFSLLSASIAKVKK